MCLGFTHALFQPFHLHAEHPMQLHFMGRFFIPPKITEKHQNVPGFVKHMSNRFGIIETATGISSKMQEEKKHKPTLTWTFKGVPIKP